MRLIRGISVVLIAVFCVLGTPSGSSASVGGATEVRGVVTDEWGSPLSGARVQIYLDDGPRLEALSDVEGRFSIPIPAALQGSLAGLDLAVSSEQPELAKIVVPLLEVATELENAPGILFVTVRLRKERAGVDVEGEEDYAEYEVFYATDRERRSSEQTSYAYIGSQGDLDLGVCTVSIPHDRRMGELASRSWLRLLYRDDPRYRVKLLEVMPLAEESFFKKVTDALTESEGKEALVFIHGYATTFGQAAERTAQVAYDLQFPGPAFLYSWPSRGETSAYGADAEAVKLSAPNLSRFLARLASENDLRKIHLLAHSMGNQLLDLTVQQLLAEAQQQVLDKISEIALVAPDLDAEVFAKQIAPRFLEAGEVTLYASSNDGALKASKTVRAGRPRAGDLSEGVVVVDKIDTIDVSDVDSGLGLNHSYFAERRAVIADIYYLLRGQAPASREGIVRAWEGSRAYWKLVPGR